MSKKTIFKRIALTAVSALAAGTLSVVVVPAANAAPNSAPGVASPVNVTGTLNIGTTANTSGAAVITGDEAASSVGLVATGDISGGRVAGTTQTAVLLATGTLVVYTLTGADETATEYNAITVENGTIVGSTSGTGVNSSRTTVISNSASAEFVASIVPNSGATTMTVRLYTGTDATYGDSTATLLAAPSLGTLSGQITVTIAAASAAGVMSTANSGVYYANDGTGGQTADAAATGSWAKRSPSAQYANIRVRDAYNQPLTSTTGLLQATSTNGALVNFVNAGGSLTGGTTTTDFHTGTSNDPDDVILVVTAPAFAPLSTTVTITYNGVEVGKKSFVFTGPITKVTLGAPLRIGALNQSATANVKGGTIAFADAADNVIYPVASDTYYNTTGLVVNAKSDRTPIMSITPTSSVVGHYDWDCGAAASTDAAIFNYVNINGTVATSNTATVSCAGSKVAYTASFDKASYTPGEVAILTVTLRDSKGNLAADSTLSGNTSTSVSVGGGVLAVASAATDASALGVVTYRVLTGVTEGTYNAVVNLPDVTTQKAVTASYTIKASSTAVSTNEVLAAIVKLIATINKQIRQLQKQLRR